jgi:DNA (cytosine-5)-methyltransferase 1
MAVFAPAMLTYASTFAGVGGFEVGFNQAGMSPTFMCEKHDYRLQVLHKHFPDIPKGGDIRDVQSSSLGRPDLVAGGFPCKQLSVGLANRAGLAGPDSRLYWEFIRLVEEHLRLVDAARPRWTVLENVPGLLSSGSGRDMAAVVLGLESLGYGWAYRVVDSQWFGSAQRRERVIIVGHRGGDPRPAWDVLARLGTGGRYSGLRGEQARPAGQLDVAGTADVRIFQKRSNPQAVAAEGGFSSYTEGGHVVTLANNDLRKATQQRMLIQQGGRFRAMTPIECERAQGFDDNWTLLDDEALSTLPKRMRDRAEYERYMSMGDAMNTCTAFALGAAIVDVDAALPMIRPDRRETAA